MVFELPVPALRARVLRSAAMMTPLFATVPYFAAVSSNAP
jgi:hypothetical protein